MFGLNRFGKHLATQDREFPSCHAGHRLPLQSLKTDRPKEEQVEDGN
jgi:hypothetical protein